MRFIAASLAVVAVLGGLACWSIYASGKNSSSRPPLPELAKDLPANFEEADATFKKRIHDSFPIGSHGRDVASMLVIQGFAISPDGKAASFEQPGLVCRRAWRIFWEADRADAIRRIDGVFAGICL
ncbi:MAG TPA: hypothetical protein VGM59_03975 [Dongiaceae bacterium]|jgi:hypothetical protein